MSVRIHKEVAKSLATMLYKIIEKVDIDTIGIFTYSGAKVAFYSKIKADSSEFSAVAASLQNSGNLAGKVLDLGELTHTMIKFRSGYIILQKFGKFIIAVGAREIETFQQSSNELSKNSEKLQRVLLEINYN